MRKLRSLTGMSVVCGSHRIGRVLQAELTGDLKQLSGIWVGAGLLGTRFIPSESLEMLGDVAVMAEDSGKRRPMRSKPLLKRAVSTDGRRMGAITGAEIDELSFAVRALELSSGLWEDLAHRRQRVTRYTVNPDNGEVVIDPGSGEMRFPKALVAQVAPVIELDEEAIDRALDGVYDLTDGDDPEEPEDPGQNPA